VEVREVPALDDEQASTRRLVAPAWLPHPFKSSGGELTAPIHGGCRAKRSEKLRNLTGGRRIAIRGAGEGLVPFVAMQGRFEHGSPHHRSTHRI
jgi:hypothetical protein